MVFRVRGFNGFVSIVFERDHMLWLTVVGHQSYRKISCKVRDRYGWEIGCNVLTDPDQTSVPY